MHPSCFRFPPLDLHAFTQPHLNPTPMIQELPLSVAQAPILRCRRGLKAGRATAPVHRMCVRAAHKGDRGPPTSPYHRHHLPLRALPAAGAGASRGVVDAERWKTGLASIILLFYSRGSLRRCLAVAMDRHLERRCRKLTILTEVTERIIHRRRRPIGKEVAQRGDGKPFRVSQPRRQQQLEAPPVCS